MGLRLKIGVLAAMIVLILLIVHFIKKDNINIKYALIWLVSACLMLVFIFVPKLLDIVCHILGFELVTNMIFLIAIFVLYSICFLFTVIVSTQNKKINLLIQELSILKQEVEKKK